jgi:CHAD domain-containing protein
MSFEWKAEESAADGVRRVLRKEIKKALDSLRPSSGKAMDADVHDARKRFKKVRAVLKLIRPAIRPGAYQAGNDAFRDAGRPLTEVRDAQALVETLDDLAKRRPAEVSQLPLRQARDALKARQERVRKAVLEEQGATGEVMAAVEDARRRLKRLSLDEKGWSAFGRGLKQTYRRGLEAFAAATENPTTENLHEWRKRVKDFWHQLQLFHQARPEVLKGWADQAHRLADLLGDDHNLAVLRRLIEQQPREFGERAAELLTPMDRRRSELQAEAHTVDDEVYCHTPAVLARRLKKLWKEWRAGRRAPQPALSPGRFQGRFSPSSTSHRWTTERMNHARAVPRRTRI